MRLGELLLRERGAAARDIAHALRRQKASLPHRAAVQAREAVKVDAQRLERLVDMLGELAAAQSKVARSDELRATASPELDRHLSRLEGITRELQETGISLRMVPVRATFQRMARLARDLAKRAGKEVDLVMSGEGHRAR